MPGGDGKTGGGVGERIESKIKVVFEGAFEIEREEFSIVSDGVEWCG